MKISKQKIQKSRVLVLGDVMLDRYWYGAVDRISPEAPVPVVRVAREEERIGGAANVAFNVASLGSKASLLSVVGPDPASIRLRELVVQAQIAPHFEQDFQLQTTVKLRVIGRQQQLLRIDFESHPQTSTLAAVAKRFASLIAEHDAIVLSDYGKGSLADVATLMHIALPSGKPILVDPKGRDFKRYAGATAITPNKAELQAVIGPWQSEEELTVKAQNLRHELGLAALLLTRSEEGMTLFDQNGRLDQSAQAREVFDVTGAGDTVIATLGTLLATGMSLRDAMPWANRAGGIVVGKFGTATVNYKELFGNAKSD